MGFWIFMFAMNILIPFIMIVFGTWMYKYPPKKINGVIGYRTTMSRKNMYTWNFAHDYCGRLWIKIGIILMIPSVLCNFFVIHGTENQIGIVRGSAVSLQTIILCLSILPVEKALKQVFDQNGNRRNAT